jgi:hypothetical protein
MNEIEKVMAIKRAFDTWEEGCRSLCCPEVKAAKVALEQLWHAALRNALPEASQSTGQPR